MLVLSRKINEEILIGKDIVITLVDVERGKVRIGITAPDDVPIWRTELLTDEQREELDGRRFHGV